jgi:hypothetical protein
MARIGQASAVRRSRWLLAVLLAAVLSAPTFPRAEIAVIVHAANPVKQMSSQQVADLYLDRARTFPGGEYALVFDLPREDSLREKFFTALASMSPQPMPNDCAVFDIVRRNPGAISYVKADGLDASVRVVLVLKESI